MVSVKQIYKIRIYASALSVAKLVIDFIHPLLDQTLIDKTNNIGNTEHVQFQSQEKMTVFVESLPMNHTSGGRLEATRHPDMVYPESTTMAMGECSYEPISQRKDNDANNMLTHDPDLQFADGYTGERNRPTKVRLIILRYRKTAFNFVQ
jgi:hypothetical protein